MPEALKIGVVYRDQTPQIFSDLAPEASPWPLEYFHEKAMLGTPVAPHGDFLAVFFSCDDDKHEIAQQLANVFPGAEIIGFRNRGRSPLEDFMKTDDGLLVVQLPMAFSLARHLLGSFAEVRLSRREQALTRGRAEEQGEFFNSVINLVESSWTDNDRKLAINLLIRKVLARLRAEECLIYLYNEGGSALQRAYLTGNIKDIDLFDFQANSSIVESVIKSGSPYVSNNYSFELKVPFSKDSVFIRSILCFPLERRNEKIGVIEVLNKKEGGGFTQEDQEFVQMLVSPLTVALKNLAMFEKSERLTITDDLTKLYNYRYLMQFVEVEVKRCLRYKKKVSLLFIDVDGFKRINDSFGHMVGSQALSEIGQVFRRIVRETDVLGRYGGDEFVVVLPETPLDGAMVIAERIRYKVEAYEFVVRDISFRLTVSLGVANCPKHTLNAVDLIKKADAAMYRAKQLSRNSIREAV